MQHTPQSWPGRAFASQTARLAAGTGTTETKAHAAHCPNQGLALLDSRRTRLGLTAARRAHGWLQLPIPETHG